MKIGILSDTHNDQVTLRAILQHFRDEAVTTIIHCGDLTSPEMISYFHGFTLHLAFGNGDYLTGSIQEKALLLGTGSSARRLNIQTIDTKKVLIVHGNFQQELDQLIHSNRFDLVFIGHLHQREHYTVEKTTIINPGAASRTGEPPYSYAILDLSTGHLNFHQVIR